jgi:hypothetical protein
LSSIPRVCDIESDRRQTIMNRKHSIPHWKFTEHIYGKSPLHSSEDVYATDIEKFRYCAQVAIEHPVVRRSFQ